MEHADDTDCGASWLGLPLVSRGLQLTVVEEEVGEPANGGELSTSKAGDMLLCGERAAKAGNPIDESQDPCLAIVMDAGGRCADLRNDQNNQAMSTLVPTRRSLLSRFFDDDAFGLPEGFLEDAGMMPSRLFDRPFLNEMKMPAVNIKDNTDHFAIELAAPGYKKDDLKVTVKDGLLTIASEKKRESEEEKKGYTRKEFSFASFRRSFVLPENTDADSLKANFADGVLKLMLNKTKALPENKAKEIKID